VLRGIVDFPMLLSASESKRHGIPGFGGVKITQADVLKGGLIRVAAAVSSTLDVELQSGHGPSLLLARKKPAWLDAGRAESV